MAAKNYDSMPLEQLELANEALADEAVKIREERAEIAAFIEKRVAEIEAKKKIESMSDSEKVALAQVLSASGIASKAAVGTPGK